MCCYREIKNFDRFTRLIQSIVVTTLQQLQAIQKNDNSSNNTEEQKDTDEKKPIENEAEEKEEKETKEKEKVESEEKEASSDWTNQDREKLFHLFSKIFLLNFPLYIAIKHSGAVNPLSPAKVRFGVDFFQF